MAVMFFREAGLSTDEMVKMRREIQNTLQEMDQSRINHLLKQFAAGTLTPAEREELELLLSRPDRDELVEHITALIEKEGRLPFTPSGENNADTFASIVSADKTAPAANPAPVRKTGFRWLGAAAAVVLLLSTGAALFLLNKKEKPVPLSQARPSMPEKDPGRNTAVLTLADGSRVELDSLGNGLIARQAGSSVLLRNGQLAYDPQSEGSPSAVAYNIITTPRGGEFTVTLPDGTRVWLNAASSLKFPTSFTGGKREVELQGEAYMAVAEDKAHPFEVKIKDIQVSVLGTHFNIMGYNDEASVVTTLVSGSVRISSPGNPARLLTPGEHAVVENKTGNLYVENADVTEETAWKNGQIHFNGANIQQIMRQVARWYDVDVRYKGNMANMDFTCTVSRKDKLSKLLGLLELTGAVNFTMEDNTIIVQP